MYKVTNISSIHSTYLDEYEAYGKHLYKNNKNYKSIADCMENPEFRKLFDTHFSNWDDVKNILMFLKLYQEIEKTSSIELNGYHKIYMLDKFMKDPDLRHNICKQVNLQINELQTNLLK
jgi:hypothetical protein